MVSVTIHLTTDSVTAWNRTPDPVPWQQPMAAGATARFSAKHTFRYAKDAESIERH